MAGFFRSEAFGQIRLKANRGPEWETGLIAEIADWAAVSRKTAGKFLPQERGDGVGIAEIPSARNLKGYEEGVPVAVHQHQDFIALGGLGHGGAEGVQVPDDHAVDLE